MLACLFFELFIGEFGVSFQKGNRSHLPLVPMLCVGTFFWQRRIISRYRVLRHTFPRRAWERDQVGE